MKTTTKPNNGAVLNEANKYYNERINLAQNIIVAILCQAAPKYRSLSGQQPKPLKLKVSAPFRACPAALREFVSFCGNKRSYSLRQLKYNNDRNKRNEQKDERCTKVELPKQLKKREMR